MWDWVNNNFGCSAQKIIHGIVAEVLQGGTFVGSGQATNSSLGQNFRPSKIEKKMKF